MKNSNNNFEKYWVIFFLMNIIEGLIIMIWTYSLPSDKERSIFLGLSPERLGLLLAIFIFIVIFSLLSLVGKFRSSFLSKIENFKYLWIIYLLSGTGVILGIILPQILFSIYISSGNYIFHVIFERLLPLLIWLSLFSLQLIFILQKATHSFRTGNLKSKSKMYKLSLSILALFLVCWLTIFLTGYGLIPDPIGWGNSSVGLLEWQIWVSWAFCSGFLLLFLKNEKIRSALKSLKQLDLIIALFIYLFTLFIWLSQPIPDGFFATSGREPNFEIYPFSDGAFYGNFAQNILIGNGFKGDEIPPRPLYILFLAVLHILAGQEYSHIIFLQTIVLGAFPVILYFCGRDIHTRSSGVLIALLAIFREWTTIITTSYSLNTSNTKLFFSDVPTAMGISLFLLLSIRWLKKHNTKPLFPLLVGGTMGLLMLIRTQSLFILPAVLAIAFFIYFPKWKSWILACLLVCVGLTASIAPWLWRNKQITGEFVFDHPESQTRVVAQRFSPSGDENPERLPGENDAEYTERLSALIWDYFRSNPQRIFSFIGAHFINSEIADQFILPVRSNVFSIRDIFIPQISFWQSDNSDLTIYQIFILFTNLALLSLGIAASWKQSGFVGLLPLFANLTYNFSNAMARNSGGRYLIPVDWVVYFYYAVGLIEISLMLISAFSKKSIDQKFLQPKKQILSNGIKPFTLRKSVLSSLLIAFGFFLVGASLPLCETLIPEKYPTLSSTEYTEKFEKLVENQISENTMDKINELIKDKNVLMEYGRALYPRWYVSGDGEPLTAKTGYEPLNYSRLTFLLVSPRNTLVILPDNEIPESFPNASDVMILGCPQNNYLEAAIIVMVNDPEIIYTIENFDDYLCEPMSK